MLNHIIVMGRLVKDIEIRYTSGNKAVTSFTIANDGDKKNADGKYTPEFLDCVAWENTAEFLNNFFHKGSTVVVEGRLKHREWNDKDGNKRRNDEILVERVYFGDNKVRQEENGFTEIPEADGELPF